MSERSWKAGLRLTITFLLLLALAVSLLGGGVLRVKVQPRDVQKPISGADSAAYWDDSGIHPQEVYNRAINQTVYLSWEQKDAEGHVMGTVSGAGIILSTDGYILTNAHCVTDAQAAGETPAVELYNGKAYDCVIVGVDTDSDVALLKIDARGLYPAAVGSMEQVAPCQTVYVMGHPDEQIKFSITGGIISGLNRTITFSDGTTLDMFQIDAAVNPGNSGGPVYNTRGQVIGMTTAKYATLMTEGIGFAIPMEKAVELASDLKEYGYVRKRPLMGIVVRDIEAGDVSEDSPAGALVYSVEAGLPGDRAGLLAGDVIIGMDDAEIASMQDLLNAKRAYHAFETVTLRVWRSGEVMELAFTFDEVTPEHPTGSTVIVLEPEEEPEEEPETELPPPVGETESDAGEPN